MKSKIAPLFFFLCPVIIFAQHIDRKVQILDSLTHEPIPFASITTNQKTGSIANEEGEFRWVLPEVVTNLDSLKIASMGYQTLTLALSTFSDTLVYLPPKTIALKTVIVSNKTLSPAEIIEAIQENIPDKYDLELNQKKIFFRESGSQLFNALRVSVRKSSIPEFNQAFWDSTLSKVPRKNEWFNEIVGSYYGDYKNQKVEITKALELEDKETTAVFENLETVFEDILSNNIKKDSYFKIRSGIIGGKVDNADFINAADTLSLEEKETKEKSNFLKDKKSTLLRLTKPLFEDKEINFSILKKASNYTFKQIDFTYLDDTPIYVLSFTPKRNEKYEGTLYVDADAMALVRISYKNIKDIKSFSLLGVSFKEYLKEVTVQFKKKKTGKYALEYLEFTNGTEGGFDRPLVITEKNKIVKGKNKQNELKMDLKIKTQQNQKYQLVVFETLPMDKAVFEAFKEKPTVLPINLTEYDPTFWQGYTIIEPNQALKAFKIEKY